MVLALLLALLRTGCGSTDNTERTEKDVAGQKVGGQKVTGQADGDLASQAQEDEWGLVLAAEDVTDTGLTLRFVQSGGNPSGELETGSLYWLERETGDGWEKMEPLIEDLAWTMEAHLIAMDDETEMAVDWTALYGQLPPGSYRLGKTVMDFRGTGDYDQRDYYAYFTVG